MLNVKNVREQIYMKNNYKPYIATTNQTKQVLTDYDVFPYPRWYRGIYDFSEPIIAEREAGWRKRNDDCYKIQQPDEKPKQESEVCFQVPCDTIFPCRNTKSSNSFLSKNDCITIYR